MYQGSTSMNDNEIREIFSRFHNLNLLTLINNLKKKSVAGQAWYWRNLNYMCPIAHGFCNYVKVPTLSQTPEIQNFVSWWDGCGYQQEPDRLLPILEFIWQERLEDAVVTQ